MNKKIYAENYLDKIPAQREKLNWSKNGNGEIIIEIENKGFINKAFQLILKKPKFSYIHLDETGSFIWPLIDGQRNIYQIGKLVKEHFGDKAEPLYERLAQYFCALEAYKFIEWKQ